jgi:hypothetical protein
MTWRELEDFIRNIDTDNLDEPVVIYDMKTSAQTYCDIIEIKNEAEDWVPFIGINIEETNT